MKYKIGTKFYYGDEQFIILGIRQFHGEEVYIADTEQHERLYGAIFTEAHMDELMGMQEQFRANIENRKAAEEKEKQRLEAEKEKEAKEKSLYGYADTLTGVRQKRVQDILLKKIWHNGKVMTRADACIENILSGRQLFTKEKVYGFYWTDKEKAEKGEPANAPIYEELLKTEYLFSKWYIENRC